MDHLGDGLLTSNWDGYQLPAGQRLELDPTFGFYRVTPRPSDQEIAEFYANVYQNPCIPHDPLRCAELVSELCPEPGRVLDVGCGEGHYLASFVERGWSAVGVEPGATHATVARGKGIDVVEQMLTEELVASLGTFDVVILAHVLEHLTHPEEMLRMIHGLLRPGGVFFCEVPNDFNPLQNIALRHCELDPWWIALPDHLNYFSLASLSAFVGGHGFEIATCTTDFPMEMFLLLGDVYVDQPAVGREMHKKRCAFENAFRACGEMSTLNTLYESFARAGVGREAIVLAVRS